ncbi:MAG: GntR family transcriptional regulator [Trebonia sp.]
MGNLLASATCPGPGRRPAGEVAGSERAIVTVPSLGDQSYRIFRDLVTSGDLAPGERVTERGLAARLSVNPTPIREAISPPRRSGARCGCAPSSRTVPPRVSSARPRSTRTSSRPRGPGKERFDAPTAGWGTWAVAMPGTLPTWPLRGFLPEAALTSQGAFPRCSPEELHEEHQPTSWSSRP